MQMADEVPKVQKADEVPESSEQMAAEVPKGSGADGR